MNMPGVSDENGSDEGGRRAFLGGGGRLRANGSPLARISSWLGGGTTAQDEAVVAGLEADRRLFQDIGRFLDQHDLAPTVENFRIARSYILGDDIRLTRAVDDQLKAEGRFDIAAVERAIAARPDQALRPDTIAAMADALAARLAEGATTFRQSHASARDYGDALSAEANSAGQDPDGTVQRLLTLTAAAIARTQDLAGRLEVTHRETQTLRTNLQEARRAADEDHLTGLPNRRCFDSRLLALQQKAAPDIRHSVALCDIDDFKAINDRHGHDTGDRVLKHVAKQLTAGLGDSVLVARHGGEEFACLFEGRGPEDALTALDDVRGYLGARPLVNQATGDGIGQVTFSAGIAILGADIRTTLRAADAALYLAKRTGKNRIVIAAAPDKADG